MSSNESTETTDSGPGTREVAYRLFATEFEDSEFAYSESDEERAPNYIVTPTGLRVNRLFAVGVLTEVEQINSDTLRGRIVDPTGAFVTYAGQYQPEAQAFLDSASSPSFVALTGKARTFEPDDSDQIFTSVRPESLSEVTADTRDRWTVSAADATLSRIAIFAAALDSGLVGEKLQAALEQAGVAPSLAAGIPRAIEYYGTTTAYLEAVRQSAVDALELVADERENVRSVDLAPDEGGETALGPLPAVDVDLSGVASTSGPATTSTETVDEPVSEPVDEPATESVDATAESAPETADATPETADATPETVDSASESPNTTASPSESATTEPTGSQSTATADSASATTTEHTATESASSATDDTVATANDTSDAGDAADADDAPDADDAADAGETSTESVESSATDVSGEDDPELYQLDEEEREEIKSEYGADFESGNDVDPAGEADIDVPDADEVAAAVEADGEPSPDSASADAATETAATDTAAETAAADTATETETAGTTSETAADTPTESDDSSASLGSFNDTAGSDQSTPTSNQPTTDSDQPAADAAESPTTAAQPADTADQTESAHSASESAETNDVSDVSLEDAAIQLMEARDTGDGADRAEIVSTIVAEHGVDSDAVEDAIDDALMSGRCYEPDEGVLKSI